MYCVERLCHIPGTKCEHGRSGAISETLNRSKQLCALCVSVVKNREHRLCHRPKRWRRAPSIAATQILFDGDDRRLHPGMHLELAQDGLYVKLDGSV